ncbi:MAG TPA: aminotransferase class IV [Luteibaculaceae bacterium]|nr:aminotransferase class IV [Luteibaculaceae bacterium]
MNPAVFLYNNRFIPAHEIRISPTNRAFFYGDGVFESIRVCGGQARFLESHYGRLLAGANQLGLDLGELSFDRFVDQIQALVQVNHIHNSARIRYMLYRDEGGFYHPQTRSTCHFASIHTLDVSAYGSAQRELRLCVYRDLPKWRNPLNAVKSLSSTLYIQACRYANERGFEDAVLLNEVDQVVECATSNIFIIQQNQITTPSLDSGCLPGVMREQLMVLAKQQGFVVREADMDLLQLESADEILLTNAISGIRNATEFQGRLLKTGLGTQLLDDLNKAVSSGWGLLGN